MNALVLGTKLLGRLLDRITWKPLLVIKLLGTVVANILEVVTRLPSGCTRRGC
ncbi:MAG: hypothetical protein AAFR24_21235 [Cyanobacteria bacterium J06627_3]